MKTNRLIHSAAILCGSITLGLSHVRAQDTILHSFTSSTVLGPPGSLTLSEGKLYGMTNGGGSVSTGTVFSMNPDGSSYTLLHFLHGW